MATVNVNNKPTNADQQLQSNPKKMHEIGNNQPRNVDNTRQAFTNNNQKIATQRHQQITKKINST